MRVRGLGEGRSSTRTPFYRAKPAMRPATARRLIELPDINCEAPLEELEVELDVDEGAAPVPVAEAAAETADSVAIALAETAPSVAPALPLMIDPEGFWPGAGAVALVAMAACWNASKLFAAVGLMAKTIPI